MPVSVPMPMPSTGLAHAGHAATTHRPPTPRAHTDLAFIVHSSNTLTNNLPPDVDNKPLARQKRRRTSPEDQVVLEQEYQKNSKPDKAARMAIVERVALGEKEVQIWFQNRRQASRRKSRPLEPHEYARYQNLKTQHGATPGSTPGLSVDIPDSGLSVSADKEGDSHEQPNVARPILSSITNTLGHPSTNSSQVTPPSSSLTYLADARRDALLSSQDSPQSSAVTAASQDDTNVPVVPRKELRRVSSHVRLSMSSNGNAQVITKDDSSPSPPRQVATPTTLVDQQLVKAGNGDRVLAIAHPSALNRKPSGRSRDSRSWTFFADKSSRSELQDKAHQEETGSAADAIGILRSSSGRHILGALSSKRSPMFGDFRQAKRSKKTPLLQRSQSLQNSQASMRRSFGKPESPRKFKKAQSGLGIEIMSADSDKENWSPERALDGFDSPDSEDGSVTSKAVQQRSTITPGKTLLGGMGSVGRDSSSSEDDDIAGFMDGRRERKSNSVSEEEELDCVHGLLSLSQGAWK